MINERIKNIIAEDLLFNNFNQSELDLLANNCKFLNFNEGDFLFNIDQEAKAFYLIISGAVSLQIFSHEHGIVELENIQDGEFLGWSWLISPYKYHFDAVIFEKTKVLCFDAKAIKHEMDNNHEFGYKMYKLITPIITERLQASRSNILNLYEKSF